MLLPTITICLIRAETGSILSTRIHLNSLAIHRVVIEIEENEPLVLTVIPWRRRDDNPKKKAVIIVDAQSNEVIT